MTDAPGKDVRGMLPIIIREITSQGQQCSLTSWNTLDSYSSLSYQLLKDSYACVGIKEVDVVGIDVQCDIATRMR
jgi:hypothetical protein